MAYDIFRKHGGYCREGMISHFQGWKNSYYGYTTRPPPSNTHFLLLTQTGIIPLLLNSVSIHGFPLPSFQEALKLHYQEKHESLLALQHPYIGTECPGLYCTQYNSNLKNCMSYLSCDDITYFRLGNVNRSKVTLIVIGNEDTVSSGALELTLNSWIGDKTVVIQYDGSISSETMNFIRKITGITSPSFKSFAKHSESQHNEFSNDSQLIGSICIVLVAFSGVDKSSSLLDKTLFNIGMDITMAEMVLLSLPGYIFPLLLDQYLNNLLHVSNSAIIIPALLTNHAGQHYQMSRGNVGRFCGFENQPDSLFLNSSQIFEIRKFQKSFSVGLNSSQVLYLIPCLLILFS